MSLIKLCKSLNIEVRYYPQSFDILLELRGVPVSGSCAVLVGDQAYILCDKDLPLEELRYTIARELGHIVLGHLTFRREGRERTYSERMEMEADIFAATLIANELSGKTCTVEDAEKTARSVAGGGK